ncbi:MAG: hypothetical protein H0Z33_15405 [Bacillaceae bacterium]|nr:hypothetical protein [Bacillaceae bacterium]
MSNVLSDDVLKSIGSWAEEVRSSTSWESQLKKADNRQEQVCQKLKLPFHPLECGKNRMVYDVGKRSVLKVAITRKGFQENEAERVMYQAAPEPLRKHLGEIQGSGDGWIIMKKYKRRMPESTGYIKKAAALKEAFLQAGIIAKDIVNKKGPRYKNLRLDKYDEIIVIDYGSFRWKEEETPVKD